MNRLDGKAIPKGPEEIRLFAAVRDEASRIPFWLEHYRRQGVDRFFIVDNDSEDGTREELLSQPDVHVFHTTSSFADADSGRLWFATLMELYGVDRWCVVADGDEFLAHPYWEETDLPQMTAFMSAEGSEALPSFLLDMYSSSAIRDTVLTRDSNPFEICPFFDSGFESRPGAFKLEGAKHPIPTVSGSTRQKVFGIKPYLSKVCLLRYRSELVLTSGQHGILNARLSGVRGVVFHFKFLSDFPEKVRGELERDERRTYSHEWEAYGRAFEGNPGLSLFDHRSIRFKDSKQLLDLGIMKATPEYEAMLGRKA